MTSEVSSTEIQESPQSPDAIQESPESPTEVQNEEEVLFVEDRRPGNVSPAIPCNLRPQRPSSPAGLSENFIRLTSNGELSNDNRDECDSRSSNMDCTRSAATGTYSGERDTGTQELEFIEDRSPQLSGQETQSPRYSINDNFLKLQNPTAKSKRNRISNTCWNCGESTHALRDCPQPKDFAQIARSRKEFMESKANTPVYKRYHLEETQRFGHFVPGELSEELRNALGLEPRQLPTHIYMMRRLGYPPAWLQEAHVSHSGIAMFDGHGKEVLVPGAEGGEIEENGRLDKYDVRKIVSYPGFNIPPPPDTYDDSQYWNCPPMSHLQSVEVMLERLGDRVDKGYKRKKLSMNATTASDMDETVQSTDSQDMEYEDVAEGTELPVDNCGFVPPLPEEEMPPPPPMDMPPESSETSAVEEPSLTELEEQKKLLLAQLNDVSPTCGTPKSRIGKIRSEDLGTPILKSVSPYQRLPSADKFSVNICDVINFENLPDSTGKYDKMSGIIRKVRTKLSTLNKED